MISNDEYVKKPKEKYVPEEYSVDFNTIGFELNDTNLSCLRIPKPEESEIYPERWAYLKYFKGNGRIRETNKCIISTYGRIFSISKGRLLKQSKSTLTSNGNYLSVSYSEGKLKITHEYVHRLVAATFLPRNKNKNIVNHKDGIPYHNYAWNLEWTTQSQNYIHALETGLKKESLGEQRSHSKWEDHEIHYICSLMEEGHKPTYIYTKMVERYPNDPRIEYERIRTLYKHIKHKTHWTHISKRYNIDCSVRNYAKEKSSVLQAQERLKAEQ